MTLVPIVRHRVLLFYQIRHILGTYLKENPSQNALRGVFCGVTGNRTRDTRIFSPLLYQLSYDTSFVLRTPILFVWDCKGRHFFLTCKFFIDIFQKINIFTKNISERAWAYIYYAQIYSNNISCSTAGSRLSRIIKKRKGYGKQFCMES